MSDSYLKQQLTQDIKTKRAELQVAHKTMVDKFFELTSMIETSIKMKFCNLPEGIELKVEFGGFYNNTTQILICGDGRHQDISIHYDKKYSQTEDVFKLSWFSSSAYKEDTSYLVYLEILGWVSNQLRTYDGKNELNYLNFFDFLEKAIEDKKEIRKEVDSIEAQISNIQSGLNGIEKDEFNAEFDEMLVVGQRIEAEFSISMRIIKVSPKTIEVIINEYSIKRIKIKDVHYNLKYKIWTWKKEK